MSSSLNIEVGQFRRYDVVPTSVEPTNETQVRFVKRVFAIAVALVAVTSIYDAFLVYQFRVAIQEQNPFCKWLISLEPECVSVFLLSKGLGALGVVSILIGLFKYWRRVAVPVAVSLVVFQAGLMAYMHRTDGRRKNTRHFAMTSIQETQSSSSPMPIEDNVTRNPRAGGHFPQRRRRRAKFHWDRNERQNQDSMPIANPKFRRNRASDRLQGPVLTVDR